MKSYFNILFNLLASLFIAVPITNVYGGQVLGIGLCIFCAGILLSFFRTRYRVAGLFMAIQKEIWEKTIEEEIFKDNQFVNHSKDASDYVMEGKVVHIPQSGGSGNIVKNRSSVPATARKRNDTDVIYVLWELTSDPVVIPNADLHELSYDKRVSVLGEDLEKLKQDYAEYTLEDWLSSGMYGSYAATGLPSSSIITTSSDDDGVDNAGDAEGATGNRKITSRKDLQQMRRRFKQDNRWFEGRMKVCLPPIMEEEMYPSESSVVAHLMQKVTEEERRQGVLYKDYGWDIMTRSSMLRTDVSGNLKISGEAGEATDNAAALFWYEESVEHAPGKIELFQDLGNPLYYGDLFSMLVRGGGRSRRSDYKGIKVLRQKPAS